jgi:hypothetical protein
MANGVSRWLSKYFIRKRTEKKAVIACQRRSERGRDHANCVTPGHTPGRDPAASTVALTRPGGPM